MADWGVHDAQAARDFAAAQFPTTPLWVIGHSLGGLCLPFQKRLDRIDRVIAVCRGPVHTSDHPWPYQAKERAFWFGPVPFIVRLAGYLPGKRLGVGPDLPAGVYRQWRLMQCYPEAMKTQLTLRPSDYGLASIGHIAAFSAKSKALWPDLIA